MARLTVVAACGLVLAAGAMQSFESPAVQEVQRPADAPPVDVAPEQALPQPRPTDRRAARRAGQAARAEAREESLGGYLSVEDEMLLRNREEAREEAREESLGPHLSVEDEMLLRDQQPRLGR